MEIARHLILIVAPDKISDIDVFSNYLLLTCQMLCSHNK